MHFCLVIFFLLLITHSLACTFAKARSNCGRLQLQRFSGTCLLLLTSGQANQAECTFEPGFQAHQNPNPLAFLRRLLEARIHSGVQHLHAAQRRSQVQGNVLRAGPTTLYRRPYTPLQCNQMCVNGPFFVSEPSFCFATPLYTFVVAAAAQHVGAALPHRSTLHTDGESPRSVDPHA